MENILAQIVNSENPILSSLEQILDEVRKLGDVLIVRVDGVRASQNYTIIITSSQMSFEAIRCEGETLSLTLRKALEQYIVQKGLYSPIAKKNEQI